MQKLNNAVDTPAMVMYCLSCKWPECWDCLGKKSAYSYGLRLELKARDEENGRLNEKAG